MGGQESYLLVGARFLRLVLLLAAVIIAGVIGLTLLDGSTSSGEVEFGIWLTALVIAGMWVISQLGWGLLAPVSPLVNFRDITNAPVRSPQGSFEMTWLTLAILVTLSLAALALRGLSS